MYQTKKAIDSKTVELPLEYSGVQLIIAFPALAVPTTVNLIVDQPLLRNLHPD
jgi:hypothetical protein